MSVTKVAEQFELDPKTVCDRLTKSHVLKHAAIGQCFDMMSAPVFRVDQGMVLLYSMHAMQPPTAYSDLLLLLQAAGALQVAKHTTDQAEVQQRQCIAYFPFGKQWCRQDNKGVLTLAKPTVPIVSLTATRSFVLITVLVV
jgi:hypothetical protein